MMSPLERVVLLISSDTGLTQALVHALTFSEPSEGAAGAAPRLSAGEPLSCQVPIAANLAQARQRMRRARPVVMVLDAAAVPGEELPAAVEELVRVAPVVLVAENETSGLAEEISAAVAAGELDCVARRGDLVPLVAALVERRMRAARQASATEPAREAGETLAEFAEILRHEVNNPLTGILGNAELLLARQWRERLPAAAIERLETIAELAVRLRETVRRLAGVRPAGDGSAGRTPRTISTRRRTA
jgi:signal transduction histidine kinase